MVNVKSNLSYIRILGIGTRFREVFIRYSVILPLQFFIFPTTTPPKAGHHHQCVEFLIMEYDSKTRKNSICSKLC